MARALRAETRDGRSDTDAIKVHGWLRLSFKEYRSSGNSADARCHQDLNEGIVPDPEGLVIGPSLASPGIATGGLRGEAPALSEGRERWEGRGELRAVRARGAPPPSATWATTRPCTAFQVWVYKPLYTPGGSGWGWATRGQARVTPASFPYHGGAVSVRCTGRAVGDAMPDFAGFGSSEEHTAGFQVSPSAGGRPGLDRLRQGAPRPAAGATTPKSPAAARRSPRGRYILDARRLRDSVRDIPLDQVTERRMTINCQPVVALAMYLALARQAGGELGQAGRTWQNDMAGRGESSPRREVDLAGTSQRVRVVVDTIEFCAKPRCRVQPVSIFRATTFAVARLGPRCRSSRSNPPGRFRLRPAGVEAGGLGKWTTFAPRPTSSSTIPQTTSSRDRPSCGAPAHWHP